MDRKSLFAEPTLEEGNLKDGLFDNTLLTRSYDALENSVSMEEHAAFITQLRAAAQALEDRISQDMKAHAKAVDQAAYIRSKVEATQDKINETALWEIGERRELHREAAALRDQERHANAKKSALSSQLEEETAMRTLYLEQVDAHINHMLKIRHQQATASAKAALRSTTKTTKAADQPQRPTAKPQTSPSSHARSQEEAPSASAPSTAAQPAKSTQPSKKLAPKSHGKQKTKSRTGKPKGKTRHKGSPKGEAGSGKTSRPKPASLNTISA